MLDIIILPEGRVSPYFQTKKISGAGDTGNFKKEIGKREKETYIWGIETERGERSASIESGNSERSAALRRPACQTMPVRGHRALWAFRREHDEKRR